MRPLILGVPLAIVVISAALYWGRYHIPSGSMKPTLLVGDYVIAAPLWDQPDRGDVIVFRHPDNDKIFVARLIGLPGDKVQMTDGRLLIDDQPVDLADDGTFTEIMAPQGPYGGQPLCSNGAVGMGETCEKQQQIETLPNGASYAILNAGDRAADNTSVFIVPDDQYFVLGDNRDNSTDSRIPTAGRGVGFVPADHIQARVTRVLFSSAGRSVVEFWNWRTDRYFEEVR